jgi:hypothetical protein
MAVDRQAWCNQPPGRRLVRGGAIAKNRQAPAAYTRSSSAMSIFVVCSLAAMTRCAAASSGSFGSSVSRFGMICQDRP